MMTRPSPALLLAAIICIGCLHVDDVEAAVSAQGDRSIVRLASFNIQVFGRKKASDPAVMNILAKILGRYDIVVVMEIRDSSGEAFGQLVKQTNRDLGYDPFDYVISERTGRSVSKEQYAVLYRRSVAKVLSQQTVADPGDRFQREPYLVKLSLVSGRSPVPLTLLCLHTEPEATVAELNALHDIVAPMKAESLLIAGDLNADCSYVSRTQMAALKLRLDPAFHWLISDFADTTVKSTDCAYDRLIVTASALRLVAGGSARVFHFDREFRLSEAEAVKVSDHYPVEMEIHV